MRLVIVESPTKAKTIKRLLSNAYEVISSFGHIRDLPKSSMGVDIEHAYAPKYVIPADKRKRVADLKTAAKKAGDIFIATDDDREGEAIGWHIAHILGIKPAAAQRIVFHEITKNAIDRAVAAPRRLNQDLIDAQQARRVLDRLVGYELSPFLWKKVARGLSAGRVQSVAVRLVVERERERNAFTPQEYWSVVGQFEHANGALEAALSQFDSAPIKKLTIATQAQADAALAALRGAAYTVGDIATRTQTRQPKPPYKTSTLQQDANTKLRMSSKQIMRLAQQLYEGVTLGAHGATGLITYMRTDSFNMSDDFLHDARAFLRAQFGDKSIPDRPRHYKTTAKSAQEAHEAIRPTDATRTPDSIRAHLSPQQFKLYDLIWRRALASQMTPARLYRQTVAVVCARGQFQAIGSVIVEAGFLALYPDAATERILPPMRTGDAITERTIEATQHFTEPSARYSDATLVKALEEHGIGRPSTYAPTISTIVDRGYVERDDHKRLAPTDIAYTVNDLLVTHFPNIVDLAFTARMEQQLDDIETGEHAWQPIIDAFYKPFHATLVAKESEVNKKELTEEATNEQCDKCQSPMVIKLGRFGKFLACSNYPECKNTVRLNRDGSRAVEPEAQTLGRDEATGKNITLRTGRFGPYVQLGEEEEADGKKQKPRRSSLLRGMKPEDVTLDVAQKLLALPRILGAYNDADVTAQIGRFGPYIACDTESRSIPTRADFTVLDITLEQAIDLLKQPKRSRAKKKE